MEGLGSLRQLSDLTNLQEAAMGPKHRLLQGTAGKRSPKKRARKRVVEEEDSDDEVLGKGRLPARGQRESRNKFPIGTKIQAISRMAEGKMVSSVSEEMGLPVGVVSQWWLQRDDIRIAYEREVLRSSGQDVVEEHIRRSQENFDRKRMEKFLNSHPEREGAAWGEKRQRVEASPRSDDSRADPDEDFAAEEYMRKTKRKESSPSSEEDAGSWSMSFVDNTPVKAKKVAKNKIKDMPTVTKLKIKELPPLAKSARKESPKKGSGSSGKVMNQIKRIKKDQKEVKAKPEGSQVKTSTYEVREPPSPPTAASTPHSISSIMGSSQPSRAPSSQPSPRPSSSHSTPRTPANHSPKTPTSQTIGATYAAHAAAWAAASPSPSPEHVAASSLIVQSPPQPPKPAPPKSRSKSPVKDPEPKAAPQVTIKQEVGSPLKTAETPPKPRLKSPRKSRSPAKVVKAEPLDEYVESKEDGCGSIMSDDGGHLTGFLEKVEKPDEKMVDRYYSPFGLTGEQGVRAKQGVKTERPSPVKGGGVPEERGDGAVSPPRSDIMSSVPHSLADAYPHLKYIPVPQAAAVQVVEEQAPPQRFQPLNLSSSGRRGSSASVEELPLNLQTIRRPSLPPARSRSNSIEEIGKFIPSGSPAPRNFSPAPTRGAARARGRGRAPQSPLAVTHGVRPAVAHPQVRAPMVRGVMPPGMRARGARMVARGRAGVVATRPVVPMVAARGRPVVRGVARGGVMRGRGGVVPQQPLVTRLAPGRGRGMVRQPPPARGRGMVAPQAVRGRPPAPRALAPQTRLVSPSPRGVAPQYRAQQPIGYRAPQAPQPRYQQPSPRYPLQPRGAPARGASPMARGAGALVRGAMRGAPMAPMAAGPTARGQPVARGRGHPAQGRPGEAKRKVTVELSDRQLAALQSLGIM